MKKILCILLCVILVFSLSSCREKDSSNDSYIEAYNDGYFEGREWGQKQIAYFIEEEYSNAYTSELDDVITALGIYADGIYEQEYEEPIPESKLQEAIKMLLEHHEDVKELIYSIEEIEIY